MNKCKQISAKAGFIIMALVLVGIYLFIFVRDKWPSNARSNTTTSINQSASTTQALLALKIKPDNFFIEIKTEKKSQILNIAGTTNLPDDSIIQINAYRIYKLLNDYKEYKGVLGVTKASVKKGTFSATLNLSDKKWYDPLANYFILINKTPELNQGTKQNFKTISDEVSVEAIFLPKDQTKEIQDFMGTDFHSKQNLYQNTNSKEKYLKAFSTMTIPFALPKKAE